MNILYCMVFPQIRSNLLRRRRRKIGVRVSTAAGGILYQHLWSLAAVHFVLVASFELIQKELANFAIAFVITETIVVDLAFHGAGTTVLLLSHHGLLLNWSSFLATSAAASKGFRDSTNSAVSNSTTSSKSHTLGNRATDTSQHASTGRLLGGRGVSLLLRCWRGSGLGGGSGSGATGSRATSGSGTTRSL